MFLRVKLLMFSAAEKLLISENRLQSGFGGHVGGTGESVDKLLTCDFSILAVHSVGSDGDFFNGFIRGSLKHKPLQNAFDYGTKSAGTCLAFNGQFCYFVNSIIAEFEFNTVKLKEGFILL